VAAGRTPPVGGSGGSDAVAPKFVPEDVPTPAIGPQAVYVTTVGYPGSIVLLFHADGRVTWK
jgi:hypothetical protein